MGTDIVQIPNAASLGEAMMNRLLERGREFDFFQAVWLLERYCGGGAPIGGRGPVSQETFRFRPHVSLSFPSCDVKQITFCPDASDGVGFFRIDITFLGLYGVSTPLPVHYAIDILRSVEQSGLAKRGDAEQGESTGARSGGSEEPGDSPTRDFLDIFHHRLISLFYRSWLKYRFDKAFGLPGQDAITDYLLWFIGFPRSYADSLPAVSQIRLLRYAGALTLRPKSAAGLEGMIQDYWKDFPVKVEQCVGRWVSISSSDQNRLGAANATLGVDMTLGEEVYDLTGAFSISVGPVDWETYCLFQPDGEYFAQTKSLVELYCTDPFSFTIEMKLKANEVPEMRLTSGSDASRLGFTSWARTDAMPATRVMFSSDSGSTLERPTGGSEAVASLEEAGAAAV